MKACFVSFIFVLLSLGFAQELPSNSILVLNRLYDEFYHTYSKVLSKKQSNCPNKPLKSEVGTETDIPYSQKQSISLKYQSDQQLTIQQKLATLNRTSSPTKETKKIKTTNPGLLKAQTTPKEVLEFCVYLKEKYSLKNSNDGISKLHRVHFSDSPLLIKKTPPTHNNQDEQCKTKKLVGPKSIKKPSTLLESPSTKRPRIKCARQLRKKSDGIQYLLKKPARNSKCKTSEEPTENQSDSAKRVVLSNRMEDYSDPDLYRQVIGVPSSLDLASDDSDPIYHRYKRSPLSKNYPLFRVNYEDGFGEILPFYNQLNVNHRIIGGKKANVDDCPYQVALYHQDSFICGSSLISEYYIITAGHCIEPTIKAENLWFRVGSRFLSHGGRTYNVKDYEVHKKYSPEDYDIALIRSEVPVKFDAGVKPIELPSFEDSEVKDNTEVLGSGWGRKWRKSKKPSFNLHKITLITVNKSTCRDRIKQSKKKIGVRQICAHLPEKAAGMCFGDSGGPLVANDKLVGIVSWGSPCAIGDADVYTSVRAFLPWIYCEMKKLDLKYSN